LTEFKDFSLSAQNHERIKQKSNLIDLNIV